MIGKHVCCKFGMIHMYVEHQPFLGSSDTGASAAILSPKVKDKQAPWVNKKKKKSS